MPEPTLAPPAFQSRIARTFDAAPELVFRAWAEPALIARWFGPHGYKLEVVSHDFRVGGSFHFVMRAPDGEGHDFFGDYLTVEPGRRLVWTSGFPGGPRDQQRTEVTFMGVEGGKTQVEVVQSWKVVLPGQEFMLEGAQAGWTETLDRLEHVVTGGTRRRAHIALRGDTTLVITREFAAPARMVFDAWTTPELMARWYGPRMLTMKDCAIDLQVGGSFAWTLVDPEGGEHCWRGTYQVVDRPHRLVYSWQYLLAGQWTAPIEAEAILDEYAGVTRLTIQEACISKEQRDGYLGSGLEEGMAQSHERLDALLASLQRPYAPGRFCWAELSTPDPAGSKAFYGTLLGWEFMVTPMPDVVIAKVGGKSVAAVSLLTPELQQRGVPVHWLNYIAVDDADQAAARARELGGEVVLEPGEVGPAARMAIVVDTVGAPIGLWQGRQRAGAEAEGVTGAFTWHDLGTNEPESAKAFYCGLFGYTTETTDIGEGQTFTMFKVPGVDDPQEAGVMPIPPGVPPSWLVYFQVSDCQAAVQLADELGAELLFGPMEVMGGATTFAMLRDPQGAAFGLLQPGS